MKGKRGEGGLSPVTEGRCRSCCGNGQTTVVLRWWGSGVLEFANANESTTAGGGDSAAEAGSLASTTHETYSPSDRLKTRKRTGVRTGKRRVVPTSKWRLSDAFERSDAALVALERHACN